MVRVCLSLEGPIKASIARIRQRLVQHTDAIQEDRDSRFPHKWNVKAEADYKIEIESTRRKHNSARELQSRERVAEDEREAKILRREYESKEACECGDRHLRAHWAFDRYGLRKV